MIQSLVSRSVQSLKKGFVGGAVWFFLANALTPLVAVGLGPLILRKIGLEEYAVLGLATYFLVLVLSYSDFACYTHLLAVYSKKNPDRHIDFGNAFALKAILMTLFFCVLGIFTHWHPRGDDLYFLLGIFMVGLVFFPSANLEWYFVARKRYFQFLLARILFVTLQVLLTLAWYLSNGKNPLFIPVIMVISGMAGSLCLVLFLGKERIRNGMAAFSSVSFHGIRSLVFRLFPMAASLLFTPYFLAYALPWYSLTSSDKRLVGAFAVAYRLIVGISSLAAPLVIYLIPKNAASSQTISFPKTFAFSLIGAIGFWIIGIPVLWFYFHVSNVDRRLFTYSLRIFSILMLGVFFLCLRIPYIGKWLIHGRYRDYFYIHLISCLPVLALSWLGGRKIHSEWVPWLACLPDFLAGVGFVGYNRIRWRLRLFFTPGVSRVQSGP